MDIRTRRIEVSSRGNADMHDITAQVAAVVRDEGLDEGQVLIFNVGSTGALTTIEYEPGLIKDLPELLDKLIPAGSYHHDQTWHDGNGHSHLRASLLGPSLTVPVEHGQLILGTWQQILLIDLDNRPRRREVVVQLSGRFT